MSRVIRSRGWRVSGFGPAFAISLAVIFVGVSTLLHAQALSGLTGVVTDEGSLAIDGAEVTATNDATRVVSVTTTSSAGVYTLTDLAPGTYTVKVSKQGFQVSVHTGVRTEVSRRTGLNATLKPGGVDETVEVTAPLVALETTQPEVGWTLEKKVLEELPINFGPDNGDRARQIESSLSLVPGVTGDAFSHRINGGADMQNEVVFDGVPVAWGETQGRQTIINPPYEMVQEFRVVSATFSAQYGLGQGAVTYKFASGANKFHGSAFEILRNEALNAVGHTPLEPGKADRDRRHNFGGSLSGPVRIPGLYDGRDRTFFHASVDLFRLNQPVNARMDLPTAAMKAGDFSAFPQTIYVPDARFLIPGCTPGAPAGQPFPGNRIPQNCFSSITKGILPLIPDPTGPGFEENAASLITDSPTDQNNWGISLDHQIGSNQSLHLSFWRNSYNTQRETNDAYFTNEIAGSFFEPQLGNGIFGTYSNVLGSNLVMTAGFGYLRERNNQINKNLGVEFPGVVNSEAFPVIDFEGNFSQTTLGTSAGLTTSINNKLGLSFVNNWLYTRGRHTWNAGLVIKRAGQESQECQNCAGTFRFSSETTADPSNLDTTGSAFASFLLGTVNSADRGFTPGKYFTNLSVSPYIQDEFRISPRLTLSAGLRWDIMRPFTEKDDRVVFMDPALPNPGAIDPRTGRPLLGAITKLGDCDGCAGYRRASIAWGQISPRLGAVFQVNPKTVLSTGVAMNYLNGGTYEFGTNKAGNTYSGLLAGVYSSFAPNQTIPGYGQWDGNPMPAPPPPPFGPTIANGLGPASFTRDGRAPYVISWTAGVQRELPWNLLLATNYVGNRAIHLPSFANPPNQLDPKFLDLCTDPNNCVLLQPWTSPESQAVLQRLGFGQCEGYFTPYCDFIKDKGPDVGLGNALRPFPQYFGFRNNFETNGTSFYNSLQAVRVNDFETGTCCI